MNKYWNLNEQFTNEQSCELLMNKYIHTIEHLFILEITICNNKKPMNNFVSFDEQLHPDY